MTDLRETVARAIAAKVWSENDAALYFDPRYAKAPDVRKARAVHAADAAIAVVLQAIREPTPAMIDAFVARALQVSVQGEGGWSEYARNQLQTMVDALARDVATTR